MARALKIRKPRGAAMRIREPGVYALTETTYHGDPCRPMSLSSSGVRQILDECPARFMADRIAPPEPSRALDLGAAAHRWLLEGPAWPGRHVVLPADHNGSTKDGKARIKAILADGKRPLRHEDFETVKAMHTALVAHPFASAAFQAGRPELSLFWRDPEFGFWCRCRPDYLPDDRALVPDYKTARSCAPDDLAKAIAEYGYERQADWYLGGVRALGLHLDPRFVFVFQEKRPPYLVVCVTPDAEAMEWAAIQNRKAREIFARCLDSGIWPGYADEVLTLAMPGYAALRLQRMHERGLFEVAFRAQAPLIPAAE